MFFSEGAFRIFMAALQVGSPPSTALPVFDVLHAPAFGHSMFGERKSFIYQSGRGIRIPADPLIRWLILLILLGAGAGVCLLGLSVEPGEQAISPPAGTRRDNKHKLASPLEMCTGQHLIQMSHQITNRGDGSVI